MDDSRFDALTRVLSSRRTALTGLLGGVAVLLGLTATEAAAHSLAPRCRKLPDPAKRRACLRRARAHNRQHRCKPRPAELVCGGRCGTAVNNCGKQVNCHLCPTGKICLVNGSCAQSCPGPFSTEGCPTGCTCSLPEFGAGFHCISAAVASCNETPQVCTSTAQCPLGYQCQATTCPGNPNVYRCYPLCPV